MPHPKQGQQAQSKQSRPGVDFTKVLPDAVTQSALGSQLFYPDILSMNQTSKKLHGLFQVQIDTLNALKHVVEGNVDTLMVLIQDNPGLLFKKGNAKAPRGQTYYNVSPYMLMSFLCDEDMLAKIMALIPERFNPVRQAQDAEIGHGGSDLVKLDFDPMLVPNDEFNKICAFKTNINVKGTSTDITFPLLENPDGLLYWKDAQGEVNFYYVNREEQTVIPIIPVATTHEEQQALDALSHSFESMENNSARRSTNKEHQLVAKLMKQSLYRQGIHYSDAHGVSYCDSHTPFQLINRYRKVIRLYEEAEHNNEWDKAHHYWREGVGMAQGEEMWLLQRICEENRPFYPPPQNVDAFKRGFVFYNWSTGRSESVFMNGQLTARLGSNFSLYKGRAIMADGLQRGSSVLDLVTIYRLVEDAKTKTIGLALESDLVLQPVPSPQC